MATTALVASAVLGAGTSLYQGARQEQLAKEDANKREREAARQKAEADRIAADTRPEGQSASDGISFGVDRSSNTVGSTNDFLVPKTSALGTSTSGRSGLGFA